MITSIIYNDKDSYEEFGLKIENIPNFPSTNAVFDSTTIDGRDGTLNTFNRYADNVIPFNFRFKAKDSEFDDIKNRIIAWLNSKADTLAYSKSSNIYKVKQVKISDFVTTSKIVRRFTVTFTIHPSTYLDEGEDTIILTKATILYNGNATYKSKPYIKVTGSGDITIYINNQTLVLKGITDYIEIDSEIMNCYKNINGAITNYNNLMYSPFPTLEVGENNISWTGSVIKIEIIPRWRCI